MPPTVAINQKGAERIRAGHPWVFRSDIIEAPTLPPGEIVSVSFKGRFLAQAFFNPKSLISLRIVSHSREGIDRHFLRKGVEEAIKRRGPLEGNREAVRLVFGESDFLPSLILDRYRKVIVFQTLSAGMDRLKGDLIPILEELLGPEAIVERNEPPVRDLEGLERQKGIVTGGFPSPLEVIAGGQTILVNPLDGQKTGLFLDQAENQRAATRYAHGRVLDLFCYQGGFALPIAPLADEVIAVDSSAPALAHLRENALRNNLSIRTVEQNAFDFLHECQGRRETFDTILLDPPPFVRDRKKMVGAVRAYKDINMRSLKILNRDGILITCSCSQNFSADLFFQTLKEAAHDARREIQILERRGAAPDHPVLLTFPESSYLQCWVLRVL